jgi:hypothetical protein
MDRTHVEKLFAYEHLPSHLKPISLLFYNLAVTLVESLPSNAERTLALRSLWRAKNEAVMAVVLGAAPHQG